MQTKDLAKIHADNMALQTSYEQYQKFLKQGEELGQL